MPDTRILTASAPLFLANGATNSTTAGTSIASPAPTTTKPGGAGIINMGDPDGAVSSNGLIILPFGAGVATNTFLMSVFAWDLNKPVGAGNQDLWIAWPLATFTCTLCTVAGVANTDINASQLFCDTITLNVGNANVSMEIISPATNGSANLIASIILDTKGAKKVGILFAMNGSATSANAAVRRL